MEEWHQKLHNNTSPDDVVICEALLAYLEVRSRHYGPLLGSACSGASPARNSGASLLSSFLGSPA